MEINVLIAALFAAVVVALLARLIVVKGRGFLSRHRVLVALTLLPLQPVLGVAVGVLLITGWQYVEVNGLILGVLAYLNGLVAFAIVAAIQDLRGQR
ncbi:hypothetical protein [Nonomuraea sediminis]|uniref:hypothetical protein n=1 Tax=Nonomuraea sediminis TaxID=2835864 RepID=UPI001BDC4EB3|nr:hypothetical protein [Nonomuraea sediminis]